MQLPDPISIMQQFVDSVNRREMDAVIRMFDEDATFSFEPPLPGSPKPEYSGRGEIESTGRCRGKRLPGIRACRPTASPSWASIHCRPAPTPCSRAASSTPSTWCSSRSRCRRCKGSRQQSAEAPQQQTSLPFAWHICCYPPTGLLRWGRPEHGLPQPAAHEPRQRGVAAPGSWIAPVSRFSRGQDGWKTEQRARPRGVHPLVNAHHVARRAARPRAHRLRLRHQPRQRHRLDGH